MKTLRIFLLTLAAVVLLFPTASAQQTGIIKGTVTDNSGAIIPAATVNLASSAARKTAQAQTDGSYTFLGLPPGDYTVSVTFPGFESFSKTVTVNPGATVPVPIQLAIRTEKQEITVQGEAGVMVSVEPDANVTALVIKGDDLNALPDDPDDLSDALQALAGAGAGPNGGTIYIDGFSGGQLPPKENIREIRINSNPFSAEFDRLGFGRIEIFTKPGTDHLHGTAYFNDTDSIWDSRNPLASNKPPFSNRNFGGSLGGPINHKSSFNFDVQRRDIQNNSITNAFYVNPVNYDVNQITTSLVTPSYNLTLTPRVDYALSDKSTLTVRFEERINSADNQGLGSRSLPPGFSEPGFPNDLAFNSSGDAQNLMMTETSILTTHLVNETRFQFTRNWSASAGNEAPELVVSNEFSTGGNGIGAKSDLQKHFELTNTSTMTKGAHTLHFGARARRDSDENFNPQGFNGEFIFQGDATTGETALQQYVTTLQLAAEGYTESQILTMGGGPSKYTVQGGLAYVGMVRYDAAPFIQDDWKVAPSFTLSLGLRYEVQTLLNNHHDWAPRLGLAWAPGSSKNGPPKTVIRGGVGIFYDRVSYGPYENAFLNNGVNQFDYTVDYPTFYPNIPNPSTLSPGTNMIYKVDPKYQADSSMQGAIGVERQLPRATTMSLTYTYNKSNHLSQTVPINTPYPGTYNYLQPLGPTNGVYPYGYAAGDLVEYQSGAFMKQNILMYNFNTRFNRRVSLQGNYQYTHARDIPGSPTNPYNYMQDYGISSYNRRSNLTVIGTIQGPVKIMISPTVIVHSGSPYDVSVGTDIYGDNGSARALFAGSNPNCSASGIYCTPYGDFTTNYTGVLNGTAIPANLVPRNYLTMPEVVSINMRIYRVWGIGPKKESAQAAAPSPGGGGPGGGGPGGGGFGGPGGGGPGGGGGRGGGGGGMRMGGGGGGRGGGGMGASSSDRKYTLQFGATFTNALNHFNPGGYDGVLTSSQFGQPTSVNTGFGGGPGGGGGAGATANNRRIDLGLRLSF